MYTWKLLAQCYWLWFQHCTGSTIGKSLCVIAHLLGSCWSLKDHRLDIRLEMRIDSFEAGIYWQPIGFLVLSIQYVARCTIYLVLNGLNADNANSAATFTNDLVYRGGASRDTKESCWIIEVLLENRTQPRLHDRTLTKGLQMEINLMKLTRTRNLVKNSCLFHRF